MFRGVVNRTLPTMTTIVRHRQDASQQSPGADAEQKVIFAHPMSPATPSIMPRSASSITLRQSSFFSAPHIPQWLMPTMANCEAAPVTISTQHTQPWLEFLRKLEHMLRRRKGIAFKPKKLFISYAWEDQSTEEGRAANGRLKQRLEKLYNDLTASGCEVVLDDFQMTGDIKKFMDQIKICDAVLVICTPRFVERLQYSREKNGNLAYEYELILEKANSYKIPPNSPDYLYPVIPLLFEGQFEGSVPEELADKITLDFKNTDSVSYAHIMASLSGPVGLLATIHGLRGGDSEYKANFGTYCRTQLDNLPLPFPQYRIYLNKEPNLSTWSWLIGNRNIADMIGSHFKEYGYHLQVLSYGLNQGATQCALVYGAIYRSYYSFVHFMKAKNKDELHASFISLAKLLDINFYGMSQQELVQSVYQKLSNDSNYLLIFDDVTSHAYIQDFLPSSGIQWPDILITSPSTDWPNYKPCYIENFIKRGMRGLIDSVHEVYPNFYCAYQE